MEIFTLIPLLGFYMLKSQNKEQNLAINISDLILVGIKREVNLDNFIVFNFLRVKE